MDTDVSEAGERKALQDLKADLRASLTAIISRTAALRDADDRNASPVERSALLDEIRLEGRHALEVLERALASDSTRAVNDAQKPRQPAYFLWLRSRLEQIETLTRAERLDEVRPLAVQLKESAASKGYREISEAGAAVARLSEVGILPLQAGVEILRRAVNRATRSIRTDAA